MRRHTALAATFLLVAACGDDVVEAGAGGAGGAGSGAAAQGGASTGEGAGPVGGVVDELHPDRAPLPGHDTCVVTITTDIPIGSASHVEICSDVDYPTNPPSGGEHWPKWVAFGSYDAPVPRPLLVHALEHGAIALLHDCDGCTDEVVAAFGDVTTAHGADAACIGGGVSVARFVVAPDPELDHPIALAAWGATYVATCIDPDSMEAFVAEHYAKAPEDTCAAGIDPADAGCD